MAKKREDFSENFKWNVTHLYETEETFNKEFEYLILKLEDFNKYKGHILDNADNLYEIINFDYEYNKKLEQAFIYAHIQNDQDTTNVKYQTMFGRVYNLYVKYNEITSYIIPEILKADYSLIEKYLQDNNKLQVYERILKDIFKTKEHILSDKEEKIMSAMSGIFKNSDDVYSLLTDADMKFGDIKNEYGQKEELTEKSYRKFIESSDRKVRKNAFNKLLNTYGNFKNTYSGLLAGEVKKNNKIAEVRGYKSALNASLFVNDIPDEIYTNLLNVVKNNIKPLSDFWKLKKKVLNVNELHLYDTYTSIVKNVSRKFTFDEAKDLILKSLSVLSEEYISNLTNAFEERWVDYCPNDGKRNGAYCTSCYNVHPYVLMSFDGSFNSVSTLAHELGHAMHYYYAIKNQSFQDYSYSIFVAEVASQVNQILLSKYLINNTTNIDEKKYLIDDLIQDFKATIYRQTMFAEFEKNIHDMEHNGIVLTHEVLCDEYYKLNKIYYGKNIKVDELIKYEWERIPHFYMNFYVYQYATAYAAAIKIAMDILNNKENAVSNYLEFLKLGCTKTPIDSLKVAGVDMTKKDTLEEAFAYFGKLVNELKQLCEK